MGTDEAVVPPAFLPGAVWVVEVLDSFTVATMPAATSAATMMTTGTAMRTRLTRGHGLSASGADAGSVTVVSGVVSVVSVSLISLAPGAGNRTRARERERVGSEEGLAHDGRLQDVGRRPVGDHGAPVHGHEAVGQRRDEGDVVLDDEHGGVQLVANVTEKAQH